MARFAEPSVLSDTGNTKADLKAYVEGLIPQADLVNTDNGTNVSSNKIVLASTVPYWRKFSVSYTNFATANTTSADYSVESLLTGAIVHAVKVVTTTGFTGGGAASCTMDVGTTSGTPTEYINGDSVFTTDTTAASGTYSGVSFETENGSTSVLARIISDVNCDTLTAGAADIWILYSVADSGL